MENRTDLALESFESKGKSEIDGVVVTEKNGLTVVDVLDENGANQIGKPVGRYVTYDVGSLVNDTDIFSQKLKNIANVLKTMIPNNIKSVLVAGLGNLDITADALGPATTDYILATRHMKNENQDSFFNELFDVSTVSTGVLGNTGIESAEIIKGVVSQTKPSLVIVVDALASSSTERLGTTVQFSNVGISPGSGVGNHRYEISHATLGVPVISMGIPTVVSTNHLNEKLTETMFVTPREIDRIISQGSKLIGMSINVCLQDSLSAEDIFALIS